MAFLLICQNLSSRRCSTFLTASCQLEWHPCQVIRGRTSCPSLRLHLLVTYVEWRTLASNSYRNYRSSYKANIKDFCCDLVQRTSSVITLLQVLYSFTFAWKSSHIENIHTVRLLTHVLCKPTHFFFHSFIATISYSLQTSFNSLMKDWADKYHVWGTPTRSPSRSNSR